MKKDIEITLNDYIIEINELMTMRSTLDESKYIVKKHRIIDLIDDCIENLDEKIVRLKNELDSLED